MSTPAPQEVVKRVLQSYKAFKTDAQSIRKTHRQKVVQILKQAEDRRVDALRQKIGA